MSRYNDNQNKFSKPCFPSSAGRIPNTPSIPITKAQLRTFRAIIIDLTKIIPKLFANPSPQNIEDLIDTLNLLSKFICSLDATSSLKAQGLAIIKNLITILRNPTFVASAVFIELQNLINYLLYITKLFRIDPCTLQELLKLIAALQTALVNSASFIQGPTGPTDQQALLVPLDLEVTLVPLDLKDLKVIQALPVIQALKDLLVLPALLDLRDLKVTLALPAIQVLKDLLVLPALLDLRDLKVTLALPAIQVLKDLPVLRVLLDLKGLKVTQVLPAIQALKDLLVLRVLLDLKGLKVTLALPAIQALKDLLVLRVLLDLRGLKVTLALPAIQALKDLLVLLVPLALLDLKVFKVTQVLPALPVPLALRV
ncbi:collagen-like repeat preface domain-containing protein [Bacillus cereus]|uniref:collagen-like repeat preface domain-containing protein n=1 Tax=Bacillus cereus TaxID=1396 RepID=UPI00359F6A21